MIQLTNSFTENKLEWKIEWPDQIYNKKINDIDPQFKKKGVFIGLKGLESDNFNPGYKIV